MSIKNRDGSLFKLSKPNPIMKKQDLWDDGSKFELHNFIQEEMILHNFDESKEKHVEKVVEKVVEKPKQIYQSLEEIVPQEIKVPIKDVTKKPTNLLVLYCMPATINNNYDPLYNENRVSVTYGQQFTFEAIVVESNDLLFKIWTSKELSRSSIIYQPSNRRWWRVEEIVKNNGFTVDCVPSSIQPSFRFQH